MTEREALKLALEALENLFGIPDKWTGEGGGDVAVWRLGGSYRAQQAITAIKEALAQPEFTKHEVENADDWSEWVCPDPKGYLMKCCDCGLVHEAEFGVVRYKSETEREDCDMVDDPNLQAVFRMRRSEEWTPEDTAHRVGGLPMEQPEEWLTGCPECGMDSCECDSGTWNPPQRQPQQSDFEEYCKTLHPLWNTRISRTEAEGFFHAGWLASHSIKGK